MAQHGERKHSKYSASGAERWMGCPGSVALSEGLPDKESEWAKEGTKAHEVLESILLAAIEVGAVQVYAPRLPKPLPHEMAVYGARSANFLLGLHAKNSGSDLLVETRIHLDFIHPDMFGTFDGAVIDYFGTLHVYDYKYGQGHRVSPIKNLQMIFYGIGLAHLHHWNFKRVRLWIDQPRIRGYDGPSFWELSILELKAYVDVFKRAVERVEKNPKLFVEDSKWCHWCKAKGICPLKQEGKLEKAQQIFGDLNCE